MRILIMFTLTLGNSPTRALGMAFPGVPWAAPANRESALGDVCVRACVCACECSCVFAFVCVDASIYQTAELKL